MGNRNGEKRRHLIAGLTDAELEDMLKTPAGYDGEVLNAILEEIKRRAAATVVRVQDDCYSVELRRKAEQGDAEAQFKMGMFYATGRGVVKNVAEAVKWFRKAAEQGDAGA